MPDLRDGESVEMKGSGSKPYVLKNTGGVYSCSCPAWRNQSFTGPTSRPADWQNGDPKGNGLYNHLLGKLEPAKPTPPATGSEQKCSRPGKSQSYSAAAIGFQSGSTCSAFHFFQSASSSFALSGCLAIRSLASAISSARLIRRG